MTLRLAVILSHPITNFSPWHREVAKLKDIDLRVFFCCDWGLNGYVDPQFQTNVQWDIPLLDGYAHEFLPIARRPERLRFWEVDNPQIAEALDRFDPDVGQVFGYAHRTNWRVARWAHERRKPLLLFSDSNASEQLTWWKQTAKQIIVGKFYSKVDGALFVSENNLAYHMRYGLPRERLFRGVMPIDRDRLLGAVADREQVRQSVRDRLGIPANAFVVVLCGKYVSHKLPIDLVAAVWAAAQEGLPIWSLLVGEGPERPAIEEFCRKQKVKNTVLTGFVNQTSISDYYVASDAIALTSSLENYGLVVSEGISFGLPVIVSNQVGCIGANDVAQPGTNAIVYPCGNRERLQEAIVDIYKDRALYLRMSKASSQISETQDVTAAANALAAAAFELQRLGIR
ncbi:MAG: glycosyltransferase family 4 protein [Pyrinomonadaceae bacterium]